MNEILHSTHILDIVLSSGGSNKNKTAALDGTENQNQS